MRSSSTATAASCASSARTATTGPRRAGGAADEPQRRHLRRRPSAGASERPRAARGRARAGARQGHRDRGRHQDRPARHRALDRPPPAARRLGGQGEGDGDRLVGRRSVSHAQRPRAARPRRASAASRAGRRHRAGGRRMIAAPGTTAWYVYGVVDASATLAPGRLRLVQDGPLAAVVSAVPLSEFAEEALAERLNDRVWLEAHARDHEDVLQRMADHTTVVPFRFGVIYRDLEDVAAMLRDRQPELTSALERVRGRIEVGVKAWAVP